MTGMIFALVIFVLTMVYWIAESVVRMKRGKKTSSFSSSFEDERVATDTSFQTPGFSRGKTGKQMLVEKAMREGETDFSKIENAYGKIGAVEGWSAWNNVQMDKTYGSNWKNDPPQLGDGTD